MNKTEEHKIKSNARRKALKTILSGVGALAAYNSFPTNWSKPIIEQVFLPAHAATSGAGPLALSNRLWATTLGGDQTSTQIPIIVSGRVTPPGSSLLATIVATPEGGGNEVTLTTLTDANGNYVEWLTITGGPGITRINISSTVEGVDGVALTSIWVTDCRMPGDEVDLRIVLGADSPAEAQIIYEGSVLTHSLQHADISEFVDWTITLADTNGGDHMISIAFDRLVTGAVRIYVTGRVGGFNEGFGLSNKTTGEVYFNSCFSEGTGTITY